MNQNQTESKSEPFEEPRPEGLEETACSRLANYLESPPPYRKHVTKERLWLVVDAHGDSILWSDQELAVDAAVEALNKMTMPRETFGQTVGRILSSNANCPSDTTASLAFRGPIERHQGTIRVRVDVQREGAEYWARVVADPIRPDSMPLASGSTRELAIHAACEKASIPQNAEAMASADTQTPKQDGNL